MKALICIDLQYDFSNSKGALYVNKGEEVIPVANRLITGGNFPLTVLTQDWHPPTHKSFASNNPGTKVGEVGELGGKPQVFWPDHCVWGEPGSDFHKSLLTGRANLILRKGMNREVDSYSAFSDNNGMSVGLAGYLQSCGITDTYIMGLALDYCTRYTALDSIKRGFYTHLITDGCRAVNINPDDGDKAIKEMKEAGVKLIHSDKLTKRS